MNQKFKKYFPPLIGILAVFAVWYIVCRAGILSSYVLPSPEKVFQSFCKMLQSGELFRDLKISFLRVGKGFVILQERTAAQHDPATYFMVRNRRNYKDGHHRSGLLFPDVFKHRQGIYGL